MQKQTTDKLRHTSHARKKNLAFRDQIFFQQKASRKIKRQMNFYTMNVSYVLSETIRLTFLFKKLFTSKHVHTSQLIRSTWPIVQIAKKVGCNHFFCREIPLREMISYNLTHCSIVDHMDIANGQRIKPRQKTEDKRLDKL